MFLHALKTAFSQRSSWIIAASAAIFLFSIFTVLPTFTAPNTTVASQLRSLRTVELFAQIGVSLSTGLLMSLQIFVFRQSKLRREKISAAGKGMFGGLTGMIGGMFTAASCASCLTTVLGFLSVGTLVTLLEYQWEIFFGSIILLLLAIYLTARKIEGVCGSCQV